MSVSLICASFRTRFWIELDQWAKVLKPFQDLTEALGGDTYTTMSSVCFRIATTVKNLEGMRTNPLAKPYAAALRHRFTPWFEAGIAVAAAVLDPKYANATSYLEEYFQDAQKAKDVVDASWKRLAGDFGVFCGKGLDIMGMDLVDYMNWGKCEICTSSSLADLDLFRNEYLRETPDEAGGDDSGRARKNRLQRVLDSRPRLNNWCWFASAPCKSVLQCSCDIRLE